MRNFEELKLIPNHTEGVFGDLAMLKLMSYDDEERELWLTIEDGDHERERVVNIRGRALNELIDLVRRVDGR